MKYRSKVPPPTAKRMEGLGRVYLYVSDGWTGDHPRELPVENGFVEFEIRDVFEWLQERRFIDGPYFYVCVVYENSTGSRREEIQMVPRSLSCPNCNHPDQEELFCEFCEKKICTECDRATCFGHTCSSCRDKVDKGLIDENGVEHV